MYTWHIVRRRVILAKGDCAVQALSNLRSKLLQAVLSMQGISINAHKSNLLTIYVNRWFKALTGAIGEMNINPHIHKTNVVGLKDALVALKKFGGR